MCWLYAPAGASSGIDGLDFIGIKRSTVQAHFVQQTVVNRWEWSGRRPQTQEQIGAGEWRELPKIGAEYHDAIEKEAAHPADLVIRHRHMVEIGGVQQARLA